MTNEPNIAELAVAAWRLERWLDNLVAERKMAAKSSLRSIKKYLGASDIEIIDPIGWKFDPGLSVEIVNNEAPDADEADLIVIETNAPIVKQRGAVIQHGRVILGTDIKEQKANNEIRQEGNASASSENITSTTENTQLQSDNELKQSKLCISEGASYWIRAFDLRPNKAGYKPAIYVDTQVDIEILLMDEKVYGEYCKGIAPRSPFTYASKAGMFYISPPYQDLWYAVAYPPIGRNCNEFSFDMYCGWMSEENLQRDINSKNGDAQDEGKEKVNSNSSENKENNDTNNDLEAPIEEDTCDATDEKEKFETEDQSEPLENQQILATEQKIEIEISDEESERLRKKNITSYNMVIARSKGLIPPTKPSHSKGSTKKKKHRK